MKKILTIFIVATIAMETTIPEPIRSCEKIDCNFIDDHFEEIRVDRLIKSIMMVESTMDSTAYNEKEDAVGILQIRPIMVREVNRILNHNSYSLMDRWYVDRSVEMFMIYQSYHNPSFDEEIASRIWNGGSSGVYKKSTDVYWSKVDNILASIN